MAFAGAISDVFIYLEFELLIISVGMYNCFDPNIVGISNIR